MAMQPSHPQRQQWNAQQQVFRRLLVKEKDFQKAFPVFLGQHAAVHSAGLEPGAPWSFQDEALDGLSEAQMRLKPKGAAHTAVWALWHITRIEDVTINLLLADSLQLFHSQSWSDRLGVDWEAVGNEMSPAEMVKFSETIDVKGLLAYRLAVGMNTRRVVPQVDLDLLWELPAAGRIQRIRDEGAVLEKSAWLLGYWGEHPGYNLLLMPATRHPFVHLNEIQSMASKLRRLPIHPIIPPTV
jgi:hypothetical protein